MRTAMQLGVIGAGAISDIYLKNLTGLFDCFDVKAICARHLARAQIKAEKYNIQACTLEEMLADPEIQLVVVLTPLCIPLFRPVSEFQEFLVLHLHSLLIDVSL